MAVGGAAGGPCVALPVNSTEVDWSAVKRVLARIGERSGDFLEGNILIGGGAAWFYRSLLEISRDRDFSAPDFSAEENRIWISKVIDFIGTKRVEIPVSLGIPIEGEPPAPRIDGIWIGSPNEGLFLTYERALPTALTSTLPDGTDFLWSVRFSCTGKKGNWSFAKTVRKTYCIWRHWRGRPDWCYAV
jgi:hypothetical protein